MNLKENEFRLSVSMAGGGGRYLPAHIRASDLHRCVVSTFFSFPSPFYLPP